MFYFHKINIRHKTVNLNFSFGVKQFRRNLASHRYFIIADERLFIFSNYNLLMICCIVIMFVYLCKFIGYDEEYIYTLQWT